MAINFEERKLFFNSKVNNKIDEIYKLIQQECNFELMILLEQLHDLLFHSFNEFANIFVKDSTDFTDSAETANRAFSQFLQHLFIYIPKHTDPVFLYNNMQEEYFSNIFLSILNKYEKYFFYTTQEKADPVRTWIDPSTSETALISVCKYANDDVVQKIFFLLEKQYEHKNLILNDKLNPELQSYLLHENKNHLSAWNIAWLEGKQNVHQMFINLGNKLISNPIALSDFLLQKDSEKNSILIRAIQNRDLTLIKYFLKKINAFYKGRLRLETPYFLNEKNKDGFTALNIACKIGDLAIIKVLLKASLKTFHTGVDFSLFLTLADNEKKSPLIYASKLGYLSIVYILLRFASTEVSGFYGSDYFFYFINHEDKTGYTALMWASALNSVEIVKEFITTCKKSITLNLNKIYSNVLGFVSSKGFSALRLAVKMGNVETVGLLLFAMDMLESSSEAYRNFIDNKQKDGRTILDSIILQEKLFQHENRTISAEESNVSDKRALIAKVLISYKADFVLGRENVPKNWDFLYNTTLVSEPRLLGFFELFCSLLPARERLNQKIPLCFFDEDQYLPSLPLEKPWQIPREALLSAHAFVKQTYLNSLEQVGVIRNQAFKSDREQQELDRFEQIVNRYYKNYSHITITQFKKNTVPNLQQAFEADSDYVLIDGGHDLLIFTKDSMFFPLLNPAHAFTLSRPVKKEIALIQEWLKLYFTYLSTIYTIHLFDNDDISPLLINELVDNPIQSDGLLLKQPIEGISRRLVAELFLLNGKIIKISDMLKDDFFSENGYKLSFRAERFHRVFFDLSIDEKRAFQTILQKYPIATQENYAGLNKANKIYLRSYGEEVLGLIREMEVEDVQAIQLLASSIHAHQDAWSKEIDLDDSAKKTLLSTLMEFKTRLQETKNHLKVSLQLITFLFPSLIRALSKNDPMILIAPLGVILSDVALNQLLVNLARHPNVRQIFSGALMTNLLKITGKVGERVPVLGSVLAVYGLIESGRTLAYLSGDDPNLPFYAELLLNNLFSIVILGTEYSFMIPFGAVQGLFSVLTLHQIAVEGALKQSKWHLQDDQGLLSRFFRRIEFALGIVDEQTRTTFLQWEMFKANLEYFSKLQSQESFFAIMTVILPEIEKIEEKIICTKPMHVSNPLLVLSHISDTSECKKINFLSNKKRDYKFLFGQIRKICQRLDPFVLNINYTLLTGTYAKDSQIPLQDCEIGRRKVSYALAKAQGKAAAALVVDNKVSNFRSERKYNIFLPIDPSQVSRLDFIFENTYSNSLQESDSEIKSLLPCDYPLSFCIKKVVVAITQLYSVIANNSNARTTVFIDNSALSETKNSLDKELQYLIHFSDNLHLKAKGFTTQSFIFFNETRLFYLTDQTLKTKQGFEADLAEIKNLRLEFSKNSSITGHFEAQKDQSIVINRLRGFNATELAIINVKNASRYFVRLAGNSEFINQALKIEVKSSNDDLILSCYGVANINDFYQLTHPFNDIVLYKSNELLAIKLYNIDFIKSWAFIRLYAVDLSATFNINFSGNYFIEGLSYYSHIIIKKSPNSFENCYCILEININKTLSDQLDLTEIKGADFDQLSIISTNNAKKNINHYIFLQKEKFPEINGQFVKVCFIDHQDGPAIVLRHKDKGTQTFLLMDKTQTEIVINNITYEIDWFFPRLLALNTINNEVIKADQLLAPLKIDIKYDDLVIRHQHKTYTLGNVSILNPSFKLEVQLQDTEVPLVSEMRLTAIKSLKIDEEKPKAAELNQNSAITHDMKSWSGFLYGIAAGVLTGIGFLFTKRFLNSRTRAIASAGAAVAVVEPLLNTQSAVTAEALSSAHKEDPLDFLQDSIFLRQRSENQIASTSTYLFLTQETNGQQKDKSYQVPFDIRNSFEQVNSQIILSYYLGQSIRKIYLKFKSSKSVKKNSSNEFINKTNNHYLIRNYKNNVCNIPQQKFNSRTDIQLVG